MPESREGDLILPATSWKVDESAFAIPDEMYVNAITTVVGEPGFHIDAQTRNALRQAFTAGRIHEADTNEPSFDEWIEQYIEDHERITSE